jgi:hypothetical protein
MNRFAFAATAVCLISALTPSPAASQAKPAAAKPAAQAAAAPTPAAPAKWVPPIKGQATVEYIQAKPKLVGADIQSSFKLKNVSKGSIALLSVEEIWYNTKREIATNGLYRHRALLNPGEVIEFTIVSPNKPNLYTNMLMFKHANGTIEPKKVTKFQ